MPWASVNGIRLHCEVTGTGVTHRIYALEPRLRQLRVPTLLIVGEHDEACLKTHRFMADRIKGSTHLVIQNTGHLTDLEAPAAFNAAVKRFLAR